MITYVVGNLFESPARVIVNTVNTVGVMGKGIAKDFKTIYPEMFCKYQYLCESKMLTIGKLWLYKTPHKWILNFPTKTTWRQPSKIEYIEKGLETFVKMYAEKGITSIAFPPLGCGNGELDWEKHVRPLMEKYLKNLPIDIFIYRYKKSLVPEHKNIKAMAEWLRSEPETLGFVEVWQDLKQIIGAGITLQDTADHKFVVQHSINRVEGISLSIADKKHFIPEEELRELWDTIRTYGFTMEKIMPPGLEPYSRQLIILFSKLPYCKPIQVSSDYFALSDKNSGHVGLQWLPKPQSTFFKKLPLEVTHYDYKQ